MSRIHAVAAALVFTAFAVASGARELFSLSGEIVVAAALRRTEPRPCAQHEQADNANQDGGLCHKKPRK